MGTPAVQAGQISVLRQVERGQLITGAVQLCQFREIAYSRQVGYLLERDVHPSHQ